MSEIVVKRGPRRDVIWEELEQLFGRVTNANTRGRRNRVTRLIRESIAQLSVDEPDAFPRDDRGVRQEIRARRRRLTQLWPALKPTDSFLANRWDDCNPRFAEPPSQMAPRAGEIELPPASPDQAATYIQQLRDRGLVQPKGT